VFRDVTARKTAEHEAEQLSERLLAIQDEERQQIALELHDSTTQHLAAAILNMMTIQSRLSEDPKTGELWLSRWVLLAARIQRVWPIGV
jgi:signal transduction histidine kinase